MFNTPALWPDHEEWAILGRFYLASGLSEAFNIILPFEFVYLYLVMKHPEWAVIPFLCESITILLMEIPTGVMADQWGRKSSTLAGDSLSALSWGLVPLAVTFTGQKQLWAVSICYIMDGIGQTLVSGAEEAWVVDNLSGLKRLDLVDKYFARILSFASIGGILAGTLALLLLFMFRITLTSLNLLWYISALGQALGVFIVMSVPEHRMEAEVKASQEKKWLDWKLFLKKISHGFRVIFDHPALGFFILSILIITFSRSIMADALEISLLLRGMDVRGLVPLDLFNNFSGLLAPLLGVLIAKKLGTIKSLSLFIILPVILVFLFFFQPGLWPLVSLFFLLHLLSDLWTPVSSTYLHLLMPSNYRATIRSMVSQGSELMNLAGLALFSLLLGRYSEALAMVTPDLTEAFSGGAVTIGEVPRGLFGLPIPDLALTIFTLTGLLALPLLILGKKYEKKG